ncbi:3-hydroxyacyl-ACP dehydratase FabZ family protein [Streptomyces sp. 796.1]|uniref:3-hydroxyacyl-ACP dehydratase FabZ family protein n=1 Tax=Streptomyces sp. 796.1 TaxID=3163029 RepID=UPI0039C9F90E
MVTVADKLSFAAPLRAVDRVELVESDEGTRLRATKVVRASDPYMAGHFPGLTMLPAVFLLEGVRQAVAEAFALGEVPELLEVRSARLQAPMLGDDEITVDAAVRAEGEQRWFLDARCTRQDGTPVARLKLLVGVPAEEAPLTSANGPLVAPAPVSGPPVIGHARIRELLPVRHPMLLVDGVVAVAAGESISGVKAVTGGEVCYQGLPDGLPDGRYTFPRSLAFESFGQTAALLWLATAEAGGPDGVLMLAAIRGCRFTGGVQPGEVLRHVVRLEQLVSGNAFMSGEIWAADRCVAVIDSLIAVTRPRTAVQAPR